MPGLWESCCLDHSFLLLLTDRRLPRVTGCRKSNWKLFGERKNWICGPNLLAWDQYIICERIQLSAALKRQTSHSCGDVSTTSTHTRHIWQWNFFFLLLVFAGAISHCFELTQVMCQTEWVKYSARTGDFLLVLSTELPVNVAKHAKHIFFQKNLAMLFN